jgi:hypothetical protein
MYIQLDVTRNLQGITHNERYLTLNNKATTSTIDDGSTHPVRLVEGRRCGKRSTGSMTEDPRGVCSVVMAMQQQAAGGTS